MIRRLVRYKVYIDRSRMYISYIQFLATIFIVVKLLKNGWLKTWIFDNWYLSFPLMFFAFIGGCLFLGYLESMLKIRDLEQENYSKANPEWERLMKKIDELLKK
jgi:hypothetical protein